MLATALQQKLEDLSTYAKEGSVVSPFDHGNSYVVTLSLHESELVKWLRQT